MEGTVELVRVLLSDLFSDHWSLRPLRFTLFLSSSSSSHSFDPLPTFDSPPPSALQITSAAVHRPLQKRPLQKLTVVLDLDETLVCAYETSSLPVALCAQANKAGLNWFELECVSSGKVMLDPLLTE